MINQDVKAQGKKVKCCLILGSVAGSYGGSKLRIFAHKCAVSALSKSGSAGLNISLDQGSSIEKLTGLLGCYKNLLTFAFSMKSAPCCKNAITMVFLANCKVFLCHSKKLPHHFNSIESQILCSRYRKIFFAVGLFRVTATGTLKISCIKGNN